MPIYGDELTETVPILDTLKRGLETKPDLPALVSLEESYTWRELDQASNILPPYPRNPLMYNCEMGRGALVSLLRL